MSRTLPLTVGALAIVVFVIALIATDLRSRLPAGPTEATLPTPDQTSEGAAAQTEIARSDVGAASNLATDAAVDALEETGQPVRDSIEEVREIAEALGTVGADAGDAEQRNDEVALDAPLIDRSDAMDPAFVAATLEPDTFDAERVVALIDATPHLSDAEKIDLGVAVQVVAQDPDALNEVLARLEEILIIRQ